MEKNGVYGFLAGLYVGRFTGWVSNFVITGITLYVYSPELFTSNNIEYIRNNITVFFTK